MSTAFDLVDHRILLKCFGFQDSALSNGLKVTKRGEDSVF